MGYEKTINDINRLENDEFTFDSLKFAGIIKHELWNILINEIKNGKVYAQHNYDILNNRLHDVIYDKLKEKLDFEDEVIETIIDLINFSQRLEDIYVLDGNVIAKVLSTTGFEPKEVTYLYPITGFNELTNVSFNDVIKETIVRDLIVNGLNNSIKPLMKNNEENLDPVILDNLEIRYGLRGINIYLDMPLHEINKLYQEGKNGVIKVLVKLGMEDFYSFDMKIRDGFVIFSQNDFEVQKVNEILNRKRLIK